MRLWQKIFLVTFSLFLIVFYGCIYCIFKQGYEQNLQMDIQRIQREAKYLAVDFEKDLQSIAQRTLLTEDIVSGLSNNYAGRLGVKQGFLELKEKTYHIFPTCRK